MSHGLAALRRRVTRKLLAIVPVIVGALLLLGVLSAITYAVEPYLPAASRELIGQLRQGAWSEMRAHLLAAFEDQPRDALFVLLQVIQVLVAPIPAPLLGLLGGALFGFWQGLLLSVLGLAIGSAIAMASSRILGNTVVRRLVPAAILARFDRLAGVNSVWSFFLIFLLPAMPDDAVCLLAGLTRLPLHRLLLVCIAGRLPGIAVLTFAGSRAEQGGTAAYLVLGAGMALAVLVWLFSDEVESLVRRVGGTRSPSPGS
jgi:uncharacterized membrane protein YdjX (TVP38/TMEM64 family)